MAAGPDLRDVTLCCIDCVQPARALRALGLSASQARFGSVLLLSDAAAAMPDVEVRRIGRLAEGSALDVVARRHALLGV